MFRDELTIFVKGGDGGDGCLSFRREKFAPKGGPDGGDGGRGGNVLLVATRGLNSLYHLTRRTHYMADRGGHGRGKNCAGRNGRDLVLRVPVGTIVRAKGEIRVLKDLKEDGDRVVIARSGRGGRGNAAFASATHQVPREYEKGEKGEARWIDLELKLIADVGLVGLPNAGKSTMLSRVSRARPKIADYPFTTLAPYLGIVEGPDYRSLVMADLPGLIEGAHRGVGLGDRFLRHIERTRLLAFILDAAPLSGPAPWEAYQTLKKELELYSPTLAQKPFVIVANKMDLPGAEESLRALKRKVRRPLYALSAVTGSGLKEFILCLFDTLEQPIGQQKRKSAKG